MAKWYAVINGRVPGVYTSLQDATSQVNGVKKSFMRAFNSEEAAHAAFSAAPMPAAKKQKVDGAVTSSNSRAVAPAAAVAKAAKPVATASKKGRKKQPKQPKKPKAGAQLEASLGPQAGLKRGRDDAMASYNPRYGGGDDAEIGGWNDEPGNWDKDDPDYYMHMDRYFNPSDGDDFGGGYSSL